MHNTKRRGRRAARRRPAPCRDLGDAAHRPLRLVTTNDGAPSPKRSRPQDDRAVMTGKMSKKTKLVEGPLGDELGAEELHGDGACVKIKFQAPRSTAWRFISELVTWLISTQDGAILCKY